MLIYLYFIFKALKFLFEVFFNYLTNFLRFLHLHFIFVNFKKHFLKIQKIINKITLFHQYFINYLIIKISKKKPNIINII